MPKYWLLGSCKFESWNTHRLGRRRRHRQRQERDRDIIRVHFKFALNHYLANKYNICPDKPSQYLQYSISSVEKKRNEKKKKKACQQP